MSSHGNIAHARTHTPIHAHISVLLLRHHPHQNNYAIHARSCSQPPYDVEPLDENAHTQLHIAVAALDHVLLRQIIADLIDEEPFIARALYDKLATDEESGSDDEPEEVQVVPPRVGAATAGAPPAGVPPPPPTAQDKASSSRTTNPPLEVDESGSEHGSSSGGKMSDAGEDDGEPPPPASSSEPLLVPTTEETETCVNCDESFDAGTDRLDGECVYHPGMSPSVPSLFLPPPSPLHILSVDMFSWRRVVMQTADSRCEKTGEGRDDDDYDERAQE